MELEDKLEVNPPSNNKYGVKVQQKGIVLVRSAFLC
jgi:hypothetical protein